MKRWVARVLGTAVGLALLTVWWESHSADVADLALRRGGWLLAGVLAAAGAMALQWCRTAWLLKSESPRHLIAPLLIAHGLNVFLPSLLGDAYEVGAVAKRLNRPVRAVLTRLLHRFATTLGALGILAAAALSTRSPSHGFFLLSASIAGPILFDRLTPRLGPLIQGEAMPGLGAPQTLAHLGLAVLQHAVSAFSLFCFGVAIDTAVSPAVAAAMLSMADLMTYLPVPLAGVGLHHWGVSAAAGILGAAPSALVAFNHAMVVLLGGIGVGVGFAIRSPSRHNG